MRLIIFDWEGTLVKDMQAQFDCLQRSAKYMGLKLNSKFKLFSSPWHFLDSPINGLTPVQAAQLRQAFSMALNELDEASDVTRKIIDGLKQRGLSLAVATNLNRSAFEVALERSGLKQAITYSATPSEYESKPSPDMLNALVDEAKCRKDQALFVGDSSTDIEAAIAAGVKSCWLSESDGLKPDPDYRIATIEQLPELI